MNTQYSGGKPNIDLQYHQFDALMRESAHFAVQVRKLMTLLDERCRALIAELNLGQPEDVIGEHHSQVALPLTFKKLT